MGSTYVRGRTIWFRFKGADGLWDSASSGLKVGQERRARALLRKLETQIASGLVPVGGGPLTFALWAKKWIDERKHLVDDWKGDEAMLRLHVTPRIGKLPLADVRPRHLVELARALRKSHAPKTVYNVYSCVTACFRDAALADLIEASPCILTKHQLGPKMDKDPEWRATAKFGRAELELLISDTRIPMDRRVLYGLEGIGALRHGEAAGLRWRHLDSSLEPLAALIVATSYNKGRTKTKGTRYMPVHPTLAAMLAEWKLAGWAEMFGRKPTEDDLVVPLEPGAKREGDMRSRCNSRERLIKDLATLGLRHRRGQDLRRTMISLARSDGAIKDILRRGTHKPPKEVIEGYTTFEWDVLCREVEKLRIQRRGLSEVVALPLVASGDLATPLATGPNNQAETLVESDARAGTRTPHKQAKRAATSGKKSGSSEGEAGEGAGNDAEPPAAGCSSVANARCPLCHWPVDVVRGPDGGRHGRCANCRLFVIGGPG